MSSNLLKGGFVFLTPIFVAVAFSGDPCERTTFNVNAASLVLGSLTLGAAVFLLLRDALNGRRRLLVVTIALAVALGAAFLMLTLSVMRWAEACTA